MTNFKIAFSHPWMLLLLIPAALVTLLPYFLSARKYRRNRNRIVPLVLRAVVCVLCVSVAAGLNFRYDLPNTQNEIMLVVDASVSTEREKDARDEFVRALIDEAGNRVKLGVVTFGYDQVYAVPLTNDTSRVYDRYLSAPRPDGSATDIAAALQYARDRFSHPASAKIVLISDGGETDGAATDVIRAVTAEGVRVDAVCVSAAQTSAQETEIVGVEIPDENITPGDPFALRVTLRSTYGEDATLSLYDNGVFAAQVPVSLVSGTQIVSVPHTVGTEGDHTARGLHELKFVLSANGDTDGQNNAYAAYMYLQSFDKILLIERTSGEADVLESLLKEEYDVEKATVGITACLDRDRMLYESHPTENMPQSLDQFRAFDQIILVNIANADLESTGMPEQFTEMLEEYVNVVGGGLLTVGGNREEDDKVVPNTYNRKDMFGSLYQQMLPVQAIHYTPPIAVMLIIDKSGSMNQNTMEDGKSRLDFAKDGALSCLQSLSDRDWCGVMTLDGNSFTEVGLTRVSQQSKLIEAIKAIESSDGDTVFAGAIKQAGEALSGIKEVQHRHIILVTDGQPGDEANGANGYLTQIKGNFEKGITFSVVNIKGDNDAAMGAAAEAGGGVLHSVTDVTSLPREMREELSNYTYSITDEPMRPFAPVVKDHTTVVNGLLDDEGKPLELPELQGYYGVKRKEGAAEPLAGEFTPIYAQWKYGKGKVGSFMCDLDGTWSNAFINSDLGIRFLHNVADALFPTESVRARAVDVALVEGNYRSQLEVYSRLRAGETLQVTVTDPSGKVTQDHTFTSSDAYGRVTVEHNELGVYAVRVRRTSGDSAVDETLYKAFSYSAEYEAFYDDAVLAARMQKIAEEGGGAVIDMAEPWNVFLDVQSVRHKRVDPRIPFLVIAAVLFLLDIAARKFKFKWPHEIIRDKIAGRKEAKA